MEINENILIYRELYWCGYSRNKLNWVYTDAGINTNKNK